MASVLITYMATLAIVQAGIQASIAANKVAIKIISKVMNSVNHALFMIIIVPSDKVKLPMISQPPKNTITQLGHEIHLNCTAEGHPDPIYEWYKDGVLIPDKIESVLYIPEPSPEDRGNYTCKAINSEGKTDASRPAKLDIAGISHVV